jgi:glycosyltransferase involved in cell wall biosynthesis
MVQRHGVMRVAHILKVKAIAGAETHLLTLLKGQRKRGIDAQFVIMVSPDNPMDNMVAAAEERGIPIQRLPIHHHADVTVYNRLLRALRDLKPDVAHAHLQHGDLFGIPAARWAGVPVIITSRHNDDIRRRNLPVRLLNQGLWRLADGGIAISEAIRQFSIQVEGASPAKVKTIHYGLDITEPLDRNTARAALLGELGLTDDAVLIGMVCRLIELKGVQYVIRALGGIAAQFPNAHLVIAGDGPLRESLGAQAGNSGITNRVHFLGWREDIPSVMASLDVLAVASDREGFGLVILEAMAQHVPVIGTNVSAIPEVIANEETGLLVPPRDVEAITAALTRLLSDKPLRHHMGLLGRDRLETHFSAGRMVDETINFYEDLLAKKRV